MIPTAALRAIRSMHSGCCMRGARLLVLLAWLVVAGRAQDLPYLFERDVMVPMRDGTRLAANVYRPREEGRYPVILMRTPYGKPDEKAGEARKYVPAGYVVVVQDCRGRGKSEGTWDPFVFDPPDGADTLAWVGKQPWSNGEVGTAGGSYGGWTQWSLATSGSPHLKTMVPVVPFAHVYEDIAYQGGAFQLALLMGWGMAVGGAPMTPEKLDQALRHLPLKTFGDQFERRIGFLNDWIAHSAPDAYWKARGIGGRYDQVTVPILNIGGWYDIFSKPTLDMVAAVRRGSTHRLARRNVVAVMGPWGHGVGTRKVGELDFGADAVLNVGELQFKWFEYWLKGKETGVENQPAYHLFVMGENRWRSENEWPLKRTQYTPFYLHGKGRANTAAGDGRLSLEKPAEAQPADTFVYDPANPVPTRGGNNLVGVPIGPMDQTSVEQREDVLVYTSAPLEEPLEVTGPVKLVLHASSSAPDTDFTAKLVDVHPDGKAYLICDGIVRARYRNGLDKPQLLEPGKPERYEVDLWVTSNRFLRGHRVRLEVSSSNFPRFDRNPNTGADFGSSAELVKATQTILHDAVHPSHLVLPVIPE